MSKICFQRKRKIRCLGDKIMARFSMMRADPDMQIFNDIVVYRIKDNFDKDNPLNKWVGTEENCKENIRWLNENVEEEFVFEDAKDWEIKKRIEESLCSGAYVERATINNTVLVKLGTPQKRLREKLGDILGIDCFGISVYNTNSFGTPSLKDDLAIINRSVI